MTDMVVTLKEHFDARLEDLSRRYDAILVERKSASEREIKVLDERLDKMNELRKQLTDQYAEFNSQLFKYLTIGEYNGKHEALQGDVDRIEGMFGQYVSLAAYEATKSELKVLAEWKANMSGRVWAITGGLVLMQILFGIIRFLSGSHFPL